MQGSDGWDGIEDGFPSPDEDLPGVESFSDGMSTVPDPEDTMDPVDAVMRLCVRIDPRNPLHEKIYLWASRLPTDRRGMSNIGAHIIQALNRYLDSAARPIAEGSVYSEAMGPERFAARSHPSQADRARYREVLRSRQEAASARDAATHPSPAPSVGSPAPEKPDGPLESTSPGSVPPAQPLPSNVESPVTSAPPVDDAPSSAADYGFLSGRIDDEDTSWG
jgi:hypothetical protein